MTCQVLLNSWILPPWLSCHRNLPSTSQANSPLPTELHSWIIIINFWCSVINLLKMCLHRKLSDTTNKVLPETGFGLSCLHSIFAPGYVKWFQTQHCTPVWASRDAVAKIRHVGSINNILKHWPAQLPLHTIGLCLEPGTAWGQPEHSSRGSLTRRYFDLQNIQIIPDFNAPIADFSSTIGIWRLEILSWISQSRNTVNNNKANHCWLQMSKLFLGAPSANSITTEWSTQSRQKAPNFSGHKRQH